MVNSGEEFLSWEWWYILVTPGPGRLRQEDRDFRASLQYVVRPLSLKKKKTRRIFNTT
jgi:hypothetical protein